MKHVGVLYNPLRMVIVRIVRSAMTGGRLRRVARGGYRRIHHFEVRARKIAA